MRKFLKTYSKNLIVGVLAFIMLLQSVLPSVYNTAYADSKELRKAFISLKKSQSVTEIDKGQIDTQTLRIIALYLSNYYIPFSTVLDGEDVDDGSESGKDSDDKESKTKTKSDDSSTETKMVAALKQAGFEEDTASILVSAVLEASLTTAKPMVVESDTYEMRKATLTYGSKDNGIITGAIYREDTYSGGKYVGNDPLIPHLTPNEKEPMRIKKAWLFEGDRLKVNEGVYKVTYGTFMSMLSQGYEKDIYYLDSDGKKSETPCFSTNNQVRTAYAMLNDNLNYGNGIGGSFSTITREQANDMEISEEYYKALAIGAQLYIDWVGNIIMDTGIERIVIMPACMNPYVFKIVGGSDGGRINLVSSYGVNKIGNGSITRLSKGDYNGDEYHESRYRALVKGGEHSIFGQIYWTAFRGNSDTDFDVGGKDSWGDNNVLLQMLAHGIGCANSTYKKATGDDSYTGPTDTANILWNSEDSIRFPNLASYLAEVDCDHPDSLKYMINAGSKGFLAFTQVVKFDDKAEFEGEDKDWTGHIMSANLLDGVGNVKAKYKNEKDKPKSAFSSSGVQFGDVTKNTGDMATSMDASVSDVIYTTYVYAYSNYLEGAHEKGQKFDKEKNVVDMVFNGDIFPVAQDNDISWDGMKDKLEDMASDKIQSEIMSMIYYILHPVEGMHYFATWAKNKISSFFLGWHEDMVGYTSSNSSTGMTKYIGFSGYTTLPSLADMSWTNWMLENYNSIIVYLIIVMSVIMCCYVIVGSLTGQRALVGIFMFGFLAFLPPVAINMTVDIVNNVCDSIYGTKFTYWALVQHQSYLQELYAATSDAESYKQFVLQGSYSEDMSESAGESTDANFASVKLKWMSPKKDNYMASFVQEAQDDMSANASQTFVNNMLNIGGKSYSGEEYLDSPDALFLYRDYMNITRYSLKSYNLYDHYNSGGEVNTGDGDYKLQVGYRWNASQEYSNLGNIAYSSGLPFKNMVYVNYEVDGNYNSQLNTDLHDISSVESIRKGFMPLTVKDASKNKVDYYSDGSYAINYLLNFPRAYNDINLGYEKLKGDIENGTTQVGKDKLWGYGLPQSYFNFTQSDLSTTGNISKNENGEEVGVDYTKDRLDYFYYGLYSESPYYYMTYNILDQMKAYAGYTYSMSKTGDVDLGSDGNFKDMLLGNNLEYFYNYSENSGDGYGELRDFMNMHDFFYYVLPLMDSGNQLVDTFDRVYGMDTYDDVKVTFTKNGNVMVSTAEGTTQMLSDVYGPAGEKVEATTSAEGSLVSYADASKNWTDEQVYKFWHNYNVAIIFNAYSTWADTMYDCNYAKAETIKIGGKKFRVDNPLDPTSYFKYDQNTGKMTEGRPMVFSRSEMKYYGLEWHQLTKVEQKIITVQDNVYEKALDLMNYYNFDDDVLVSSYAMLQLFEFNKEFSQTSLIGSSYVMYPQSYELKAFTYDAYLRLIIANTTGDDLQAENNQSLYQRTMSNSSITFGLLLIILDVICVYIIPAFKIFFLVALFFMSILMIVSSAVKIEMNILKVTWQSLVAPLLSFAGISIGLAFIVSLFMSNGAKGVTGDLTPTVQLGDPTMVIAVMIVINAGALYLYWKICKKAFKDAITYAKAVVNNLGGTVMGAFKTIAGVALAGGIVRSLKNHGGDGDGNNRSHDPKQQTDENRPKPRVTGGDGSGSEATQGGNGAVQPNDMPLNPAKTEKERDSDTGSGKDYNSKINSGKAKREGSDIDAGDVALAGAGVATAGAVKAKLDNAEKPKVYNDKATELKRRAEERQKTLDYRTTKLAKSKEGLNYGARVGALAESASIKKDRLASKAYAGKAKIVQTRNNVATSVSNKANYVKSGVTSRVSRAKDYGSSKVNAVKNGATRVSNSAKNTVSRVSTSAKRKVNKQVDGYKYIRYKK